MFCSRVGVANSPGWMKIGVGLLWYDHHAWLCINHNVLNIVSFLRYHGFRCG